MSATRRFTTAQAIIAFLKNQYVERDGRQHPFFAGMLGIFGHGNVAGIGQAVQQNPDFRYILVRNEQSGVHLAAGYAKASNRLRTFACTSSIGPGATNMVTGAALATINRLPVLLLPGDIFARRNVAPVLQQLESSGTQDTGVNDCFKPVSRYWDRIYRPEQLITSLPEAMRVLTSPSDCGAVTLAANRLARDADLVIGIGTRYSDFTSASMTAFRNPQVRFVNINTAEFDAYKVAAIPVVADARASLEQLTQALSDYRVGADYTAQAADLKQEWEAEVDRLFHLNSP